MSRLVYPYKIETKEDLLRVSELASKEPYDIYINTPFGSVNAKSLLGLFTMLGKEVNIVAGDGVDVEQFQHFLQKL